MPPAGAKPPAPPTETKPKVKDALAPPASVQDQLDGTMHQAMPQTGKTGKIVPVIPLPSPAQKAAMPVNGATGKKNFANTTVKPEGSGPSGLPRGILPVSGAGQGPQASQTTQKSVEDANRDARAAVAEAMAKLTGAKKPADNGSAVDTLNKKVGEMRVSNGERGGARGRGHRPDFRGGRGSQRGGRELTRKVEVPKEDFDFQSANAKFNREDVAKEATAVTSPVTSPTDTPTSASMDGSNGGLEAAPASTAAYSKGSSFFDNISSEHKDRAEAGENRMGGREFRNEERNKNMETFGQGSVDSGFRYGGRGRGRGRGFRGRGRGGGGRGFGGGGGVRGGAGGQEGGQVALEG